MEKQFCETCQGKFKNLSDNGGYIDLCSACFDEMAKTRFYVMPMWPEKMSNLKWIKCSERLPKLPDKDDSTEYLVLCNKVYLIASWQRDFINGGYIKKGKLLTEIIYKNNGYWKIHQCDEHDCNFEDEITHWQSLPKEPEEE